MLFGYLNEVQGRKQVFKDIERYVNELHSDD
jgi:hypothetical protein